MGILLNIRSERERRNAGVIFIDIHILLNTTHHDWKASLSLNPKYVWEATVTMTGI